MPRRKAEAVEDLEVLAEAGESDAEDVDPVTQWKNEVLSWENEHLVKMDPKQANIEFGQISALVREIGERCNRRLILATQGKCCAPGCNKPYGMRPYNQFSVYNKLIGKTEEKYVCSEACAAKMRDVQHKMAIELQSGVA